MPRGRQFWGPGFWKRGTQWPPGSGGFRGGAYFYNAPWSFRPCWKWPPPWQHFAYQPWAVEAQQESEIEFLQEQAEILKEELEEIENRLAELETEQEKGQEPH